MSVFYHISELSSLTNSIVTIGTFDGVHLGHQKIIKRLVELKQKQGGEIVLFTFDPHPRKVLFPEQKDLKLITTTQEKCEILKLFGVDYVLVYPFTKEFSKMQAQDYISDIIVKLSQILYPVLSLYSRFCIYFLKKVLIYQALRYCLMCISINWSTEKEYR